jgi:hypothetical protein
MPAEISNGKEKPYMDNNEWEAIREDFLRLSEEKQKEFITYLRTLQDTEDSLLLRSFAQETVRQNNA